MPGVFSKEIKKGSKALRRLSQGWWHTARYRLWQLRHGGRPYREFYSDVMKSTIEKKGAKAAVGKRWDTFGKMQLDFLVGRGMRPNHRMLDLGCGALRAGCHFIEYLDEGNYYGIDISAEILEAGEQFLREAGLEHKRPTLRQTHDMRFDELTGETFDFIMAQSVLTHVPMEDVRECFAHIGKLMHESSQFFATFYDGGNRTYTPDYLNFYYPFHELQSLGGAHGYEVIIAPEFVHPRKQTVMRITKRGANKATGSD